MSLRGWTALASLVVGLVHVAAGVAHDVGVTAVAMRRDGLFDTRHTVLLTVGWTLLAPGIGFLAAAPAIRRGRAWGYAVALVAASFLLVEFVLLGGALGTLAQDIPAWAGAVGFIILVAVAWRREARATPAA